MNAVLVAAIQLIIAETPAAIALWQQIKPILEEGRAPTAAESSAMQALMAQRHQELQAAAGAAPAPSTTPATGAT